MKKRLIVNVTARDIKLGQTPNQTGPCFKNCAIARALQRLLKNPNATWAYSYGDGGDNTPRLYAVDGKKTTDFVTDHDAGRAVKPFKFEIEERA